MALSDLNIRLILNDKEFQSGLSRAQKSMTKFGKSMQNIGKSMSMNVTLPILAAGGAMIKFASDNEESLNKVRVAFGNSS